MTCNQLGWTVTALCLAFIASAQSVFVSCDSSVASDMIIQRRGFVNKPEVLELIQSHAKELAKMNVST